MNMFLTLFNAPSSHDCYSLVIHFMGPFSSNPSISLGFPFFLFLPFILESVFNFSALCFYSYFSFVAWSFIFCLLLFHFLSLGALLMHCCTWPACFSFQFVLFYYHVFIYAFCLKQAHTQNDFFY